MNKKSISSICISLLFLSSHGASLSVSEFLSDLSILGLGIGLMSLQCSNDKLDYTQPDLSVTQEKHEKYLDEIPALRQSKGSDSAEKSKANAILGVQNFLYKRDLTDNVIIFFDEKKEIDKISLRNIGNTCYINTFIQPVLQFPRLIELIKGVDETKIKERFNEEIMCNFLLGVHQLVLKITEDKKLSYDDWQSCAKLMGHQGQFGTANDFWEKLLDAIKEYYGYYWGEDEKGKKIYCPGKSINEIVLDATVFDAPLDVEKKVIDEMKKQYLSEEKQLFRNSLRASFGIFRITIPSYLEALEERNGKELKGLENTFEKFTISTNGNQEIWTDYGNKVERAEANLKAITINYPGHWIAYTKQEDGYYKHNDGSISKISKEDMMNEIIKNPIGTTLIYSINKLK